MSHTVVLIKSEAVRYNLSAIDCINLGDGFYEGKESYVSFIVLHGKAFALNQKVKNGPYFLDPSYDQSLRNLSTVAWRRIKCTLSITFE